jgi:hypothetical protein
MLFMGYTLGSLEIEPVSIAIFVRWRSLTTYRHICQFITFATVVKTAGEFFSIDFLV